MRDDDTVQDDDAPAELEPETPSVLPAPPPDYQPLLPESHFQELRDKRSREFAANAKAAVIAALAAQPHRGSPHFDDLKVVADAIITTLAEEMRV